jgi:type II secretory pathway pseudopilin PulG
MKANQQPTAAVLLEVLLALTLFVMAAAVVGSAQHRALRAAHDMRVETQAANLVQTVLADLATGGIELANTPATAYDEEDETWTYEILVEPVSDAENLKRVTVIVKSSHPFRPAVCQLTQWMFDPGPEAEQGGLAP